jgi:hypothetical protein
VGDPKNTVREGEMWVDDDRKSIFSNDPETGERVVDRYYGGEWHRYNLGAGSSDDGSEDDE